MQINSLAKKCGFKNYYLSGNFAKINKIENNKAGNLILVTAMTSNKYGIGKTTISIGLADALNHLGKNAMLSLREPSMGPVFGVKGGATGGGKSSLKNSDEINLFFTGDFFAIEQANNLICSAVDNHIFFGNELKIDTNNILFKRCIDLNERSLREITYKIKGQTIHQGFNITAASEIMAILCLSTGLDDLKKRIGDIIVAFNTAGKPVFARDLKVEESATLLLKEALKPNLAQTIYGTPALVHLGPFANIAHGCSSVMATKYALCMSDYCVTEAGFGSDLGGEKFLDIKTRIINKTPNAVVLVVNIAVVKEHGQGSVSLGFANVKRHIENLKDKFNMPVVVAINKYTTDSKEDVNTILNLCNELKTPCKICEPFVKGYKGCLDLAECVTKICSQKPQKLNYTYDLNNSIEDKILKISKNIYGASGVEYSKEAKEKLEKIKKLDTQNYFVNIAKTQFSFSDNKELLNAPTDFVVKITDIELLNGAKFIVAKAGNMILMPGLARVSNYQNMKIDGEGNITGIV